MMTIQIDIPIKYNKLLKKISSKNTFVVIKRVNNIITIISENCDTTVYKWITWESIGENFHIGMDRGNFLQLVSLIEDMSVSYKLSINDIQTRLYIYDKHELGYVNLDNMVCIDDFNINDTQTVTLDKQYVSAIKKLFNSHENVWCIKGIDSEYCLISNKYYTLKIPCILESNKMVKISVKSLSEVNVCSSEYSVQVKNDIFQCNYTSKPVNNDTSMPQIDLYKDVEFLYEMTLDLDRSFYKGISLVHKPRTLIFHENKIECESNLRSEKRKLTNKFTELENNKKILLEKLVGFNEELNSNTIYDDQEYNALMYEKGNRSNKFDFMLHNTFQHKLIQRNEETIKLVDDLIDINNRIDNIYQKTLDSLYSSRTKSKVRQDILDVKDEIEFIDKELLKVDHLKPSGRILSYELDTICNQEEMTLNEPVIEVLEELSNLGNMHLKLNDNVVKLQIGDMEFFIKKRG